MICAHCYYRYTEGDCPNCGAAQTLREVDTGPRGSE
jgi:hypothetical protein